MWMFVFQLALESRISIWDLLMLAQYLTLRILINVGIRFFCFNIDYRDVAVFTISIKGKPKLQHNGYSYTRSDSRSNGITVWRCERTRRHGCKGRSQTRIFGRTEMVLVTAEHNHPSNHVTDERVKNDQFNRTNTRYWSNTLIELNKQYLKKRFVSSLRICSKKNVVEIWKSVSHFPYRIYWCHHSVWN